MITDEMAERAWAVLSQEIQPPYPFSTRILDEEWGVMTVAQQRDALAKVQDLQRKAHAKSIALMRRVLEAALIAQDGAR